MKNIKSIIITLTLVIIALGSGYMLGQRNARVERKVEVKTVQTMPDKIDLSDKDQFDYICNFMGQIVDWNCAGGTDDELAVYTKDGYEVYAQKGENIYPANIKQFIGFNDIQSWETNGNQLVITTTTGNNYTFK